MTKLRARWGAAWAALLACLWPAAAHAGPLETLRSVAIHPEDPRSFAAVYAEAGGGLLITRDGGATFRLNCISAIVAKQTIGRLLPTALWSGDGHLHVATFQGLFRDDGTGCGFARDATFGELNVADLLRDPDDAATLYALTSSGGAQNGLYKSSDHGASWNALGPLEPTFFRRMRIARLPDATRRFYLSVAQPPAEPSGGIACAIRVSSDEGASFVSHPFPDATDLLLLGIDSIQPDRLYAAASFAGRAGQVIYANDAQGDPAAWRELGEVSGVGSFVTLEQGGFAVLDVVQHTLWRSDVDASQIEAVETRPNLSCYEKSVAPGERFVCDTWDLRFRSSDQAEDEQTVLDLNQVSDFVACGDQVDLGLRCEAQLEYGWCGPTHYPRAPVCQLLPGAVPVAPDAGDAEPDAGPPMVEPPEDDKACALGRTASSGAQGLAFGLVACVWALRARRRRAV